MFFKSEKNVKYVFWNTDHRRFMAINARCCLQRINETVLFCLLLKISTNSVSFIVLRKRDCSQTVGAVKQKAFADKVNDSRDTVSKLEEVCNDVQDCNSQPQTSGTVRSICHLVPVPRRSSPC